MTRWGSLVRIQYLPPILILLFFIGSVVHKFKCEKLVRDRILEILQSGGEVVKFKTLEGDALLKALRTKLLEEAEELAKETDLDKIIYEIADVLEVIRCLSEHLGIDSEKILQAKQEKAEKLGSFKKGYFVDSVEIEKDHPRFFYYSDCPEKYPEIKFK